MHIFGILCLIISRKINTQLKCKNGFVPCVQKVLCLIKCVKVVCEVSALHHAGDSQHTQNIHINKVTGENEIHVFYFMEKTIRTVWPTQRTALDQAVGSRND